MATATSNSASEYPGAAPAACRQVLRRERAAPDTAHTQLEFEVEAREVRVERTAREPEIEQSGDEHVARDARKGIEVQDPAAHGLLRAG